VLACGIPIANVPLARCEVAAGMLLDAETFVDVGTLLDVPPEQAFRASAEEIARDNGSVRRFTVDPLGRIS